MIELAINGVQQTLDPPSSADLKDHLHRSVPHGHVICRLLVNGLEVDEARLDEFALDSIQTLEVQTAAPTELARSSLPETREWIQRICGVLDSISEDYRLGREGEGANRLVSVVDALQVLIGLLDGIHSSLPMDAAVRLRFEEPWQEAASDLEAAVRGLMEDLEAGDPLRLADRTGYALPRSLGRFRDVLGEIPA